MDYKVKVTTQGKAVDLLSAASGLPKTRIKDAMAKGAVWLRDGQRVNRLRRASRGVDAGAELTMYYNPDILNASPPEPALVDDQQTYSVWYKPAGLMSSGSRYGDHHSIVRCVETRLARPTFLVHRLDRFTRGLMLFAHQKRTAAGLARQFRERTVRKWYQAELVGHINKPIEIDVPLDGKPAFTYVQPQQQLANSCFVTIRIDTGRKHQIRRHAAHIGHPVVGDVAYGGAVNADLRLAAVELDFMCPEQQIPVGYLLPTRWCLFTPPQS